MDSKALYCLTSSLAAKLLSVNTKGYGCEKVCFWIFLHWTTYRDLCTSVNSKHQNINIVGN